MKIDSFYVEQGQTVAVIGPSGCGKTTLVSLIAGIQKAEAGSIRIGDSLITELGEKAVRRFRLAKVGLVPQRFELLDYLTVRENVLLPYRLGTELSLDAEVQDRAENLMQSVGIEKLGDRLPENLSQGERQRTAICRGLITKPQLILADEPTGNLDPTNQEKTVQLLLEQSVAMGATVLMVTHEPSLLPQFERTVDLMELRNGGGK
ncbi:MAG: ATP-binding cassette domain-containing protein [Verrucomicrobiota bacterium]